MKNGLFFCLLVVAAILVVVPANQAEAQCEMCKWCGVPIQPWLEECDHSGEYGYENCDDFGCLSQTCIHGPLHRPCEPEIGSILEIKREQLLAEQQGASVQEHVLVGGLTVYSGTLSPSIPGSGSTEAIAGYFAYRQWNSCSEVQRRLTEANANEVPDPGNQ